MIPTASSPEDAGSAEHPCWRELPGGASFGTLVHAILEQLDFKADLTSPEVRQLVRDEVARSGLEPQLSSNLLAPSRCCCNAPSADRWGSAASIKSPWATPSGSCHSISL